MHLKSQLNAIACHLVALFWIPIAAILSWGVGQTQLGKVMFLGSLALAADWQHSANFAIVAWLVFIVLFSIIFVLWMPLVLVLQRLNLQTPDKLIYRSGVNAFNWLLSCILCLIVSTIAVEWGDRLVAPPDNSPWVSWSLVILILMMAIGQIIFAIRVILGIFQGQSKRYFLAIPFLRMGDRI